MEQSNVDLLKNNKANIKYLIRNGAIKLNIHNKNIVESFKKVGNHSQNVHRTEVTNSDEYYLEQLQNNYGKTYTDDPLKLFRTIISNQLELKNATTKNTVTKLLNEIGRHLDIPDNKVLEPMQAFVAVYQSYKNNKQEELTSHFECFINYSTQFFDNKGTLFCAYGIRARILQLTSLIDNKTTSKLKYSDNISIEEMINLIRKTVKQIDFNKYELKIWEKYSEGWSDGLLTRQIFGKVATQVFETIEKDKGFVSSFYEFFSLNEVVESTIQASLDEISYQSLGVLGE